MNPARSALATALRDGAKASFEEAKGMEVYVAMEEHSDLVYEAGRLLRETEEASDIDGFRLLMGEIEFLSGHHFHAIIVVCVPDAYEHFGTYVLVPYPEDPEGYRLLEQGTSQFDRWIRRARQADPSIDFESGYRYRYLDKSLKDHDGHLGDDGWSLQ